MKVIFFVAYWWPHRGGVEKHSWRVAQELVKMGHQVDVVTYQDGVVRFKEEGITVHFLPAHARDHKMNTWRAIWQLRAICNSADILHIHDVAWWMWPWWWLWRDKIFLTFHGWETRWPISYKAKIQRWLANTFAQGTIHIGSWIQKYYWDRPTKVIYGGSDIKQLSPVKVHKNSISIVFVGRLASDTHVIWYTKVLAQLKKQGCAVTMTWVGDGDLRSVAEVHGRVTGMVADPQDYVRSATVVFANSYLSILDAQAAGRVVVAGATNPLKYAYLQSYPGSPWLILETDPVVAARVLIKLWSHPQEMNRLILEQTQWAHRQSWKKCALVYQSLWNHL